MTYSLQAEQFETIWDELDPLLHDHYHEVAMFQDKIDLNVDKAFYEYAQEAGRVHLHTARDQESKDILGYCVSFVNANPHYTDHVYAVNDVLFVRPDNRGSDLAPALLAYVEDCMQRLGVSVMTFHMKEYKPFRSLMAARGFEPKEELWAKFIGD